MPREQYQDIKISGERLLVIERANAIISEYARQGFDLTLRQLYYQFVARGLIPNKDSEYKRLGTIISDGRLAGLVDWNAITDRTRYLRSYGFNEDARDVVENAALGYAVDKWARQKVRIEVWIEKDALVGVIERVCSALEVPYFSCRGYTSLTEMWHAGRRLRGYQRDGFDTYVLHLGDHDPSGVDMTRDIIDRLDMFMGGTEVHRLALTMDQIDAHNPPPNPAKLTDSRCKGYIEIYGSESWELDALPPTVLAEVVRTFVEQHRDTALWAEAVKEQREARARIKKLADYYEDVEPDEDEDEDEDGADSDEDSEG